MNPRVIFPRVARGISIKASEFHSRETRALSGQLSQREQSRANLALLLRVERVHKVSRMYVMPCARGIEELFVGETRVGIDNATT